MEIHVAANTRVIQVWEWPPPKKGGSINSPAEIHLQQTGGAGSHCTAGKPGYSCNPGNMGS